MNFKKPQWNSHKSFSVWSRHSETLMQKCAYKIQAVYSLCCETPGNPEVPQQTLYTAFFFANFYGNFVDGLQAVYCLCVRETLTWRVSQCKDSILPFFSKNKQENCMQKEIAYDTRSSQAVPHPSTILARRCLTSVIERERVLSSWYGRRQWLMNVLRLYALLHFKGMNVFLCIRCKLKKAVFLFLLARDYVHVNKAYFTLKKKWKKSSMCICANYSAGIILTSTLKLVKKFSKIGTGPNDDVIPKFFYSAKMPQCSIQLMQETACKYLVCINSYKLSSRPSKTFNSLSPKTWHFTAPETKSM